jgi:hypothetical protein
MQGAPATAPSAEQATAAAAEEASQGTQTPSQPSSSSSGDSSDQPYSDAVPDEWLNPRPMGLPCRAFDQLRTQRVFSRLQLLLDRRQVTARFIQCVCAQRSEGLLESDFKELARFSPVPIVASTKADFAHRKSFIDWQQQNLSHIYAEASVHGESHLRSGASSEVRVRDIPSGYHDSASESTGSTPRPHYLSTHAGPGAGMHKDARLSTSLLPYDFDFTDSPLLCVEDERAAAGELTLSDHLMFAQSPDIATITIRIARSQDWKEECASSGSSVKKERCRGTGPTQHIESMGVDSSCEQRHSRKQPSSDGSREDSPTRSERDSETSRARLDDARQKRQRTHLHCTPPMDSEQLALSMDRRRKAFGSSHQPSQYDFVTTDHNSRCPYHAHSAKMTDEFYQHESGCGGDMGKHSAAVVPLCARRQAAHVCPGEPSVGAADGLLAEGGEGDDHQGGMAENGYRKVVACLSSYPFNAQRDFD